MKKVIVLLLCIGCLLSLFVGCNDSDNNNKWEKKKDSKSNVDEDEENIDRYEPNDSSDFEWEYVDSGVQITRYTGERTDVVIPTTLDGKKVCSVGNTFEGNIMVESIVLPEYVTELDVRWFLDCESLERIESLGCEEIVGISTSLELLSVKELYLPKLLIWHGTLYNGCFPSLEYLSMPSVEFVTNFSNPRDENGERLYMIEAWPQNLKEIVVNEELFASTGYESFFVDNGENVGTNFSRIGVLLSENELVEGHDSVLNILDEDFEEYANHYTEITDENAAYIYCNFFQKDELIVNGKTYEIE